MAALHDVGSSHISPLIAEFVIAALAVAIFAPADHRLLPALQGRLGIGECSLTEQCAYNNALIACWRDDPIGVGLHLAFVVDRYRGNSSDDDGGTAGQDRC
jgi:hypothetical protein